MAWVSWNVSLTADGPPDSLKSNSAGSLAGSVTLSTTMRLPFTNTKVQVTVSPGPRPIDPTGLPSLHDEETAKYPAGTGPAAAAYPDPGSRSPDMRGGSWSAREKESFTADGPPLRVIGNAWG